MSKAPKEKPLRFGAESSILDTVSSPIEHGPHNGKGEPWAILRHSKPLTRRQQALLDRLPTYGSETDVKKSDVSMMDLAALTAKTGAEFAMFTRGPRRLIVRGNAGTVNIDKSKASEMNAQGYRWSGHTHINGVVPSGSDKDILRQFKQMLSSVYDAVGDFNFFGKT